MHRVASRWPLLALFALALAAVAFFGGGSGWAGRGYAITNPNLTGVSCSDIFLDIYPLVGLTPSPDGIPDDLDGDTVNGDYGDISSKSISRTEPSQTSPGDYDITTVSYLGADLVDGDEPFPDDLIADAPPTTESCQAKSTDAKTTPEGTNPRNGMNPGNIFVSQFGNRPTATATFNSATKEFSFKTCGWAETLSLWVRIDVTTTILNDGPNSKNDGEGTLYYNTSAPSATVPGKPNEAADPLTCDISGPSVFPFTFLIASHERTATTDHPTLSKNAPLIGTKLIEDPDGPHPKMKGTPQNPDADLLPDDWDGDGCPDWDELDKNFTHTYPPTLTGPVNGLDPFNPNDCDFNYNSNILITSTVLHNDPNNPNQGQYFRCLGDVSHSKTGGQEPLTLRLGCYNDSTLTVVNSSYPAAGGAENCPPAPASMCGDGKAGPPPPPPFVDIDPATYPIVASGTYNTAANTLVFDLCLSTPGAFGPYTKSEGLIEAHTGAGTFDLWIQLDQPDCSDAGPTPTFEDAEVEFVETKSKNAKGGGKIAPRDHYDADLDNCSDTLELGSSQQAGGLRDPFNPWDYFNPTKDGQNRVDDILAVVAKYFIDSGNPLYTTQTDRQGVPGASAWNLREPNGQHRVDDILAAVGSYFHDCPRPTA